MYKEIIDRISVEKQKKDEAERIKMKGKRSYLYASDIFQCMRKIYFEFIDDSKAIQKDEFEPHQVRLFHNGNMVHERLTSYLMDAKLDIIPEVEIPIDPVLKVHGRLDNLVREHGKNKHILEFKSINLPTVSKPKPEHTAQLTYYLGQMKMDEGYLIYESKANQRIYEFKVEFDAVFFKEITDWFAKVWDYVDKKEIPPIIYCKTRYPCKWKTGRCRYYDNCWSKGINRHGAPFIKRFIPGGE